MHRPPVPSCNNSNSSSPDAVRSAARAVLPMLLAAGLTGSVGLASQTTDSEVPSGLVERSQVELVLIEVVALDGRGRHVRGLDRSGFRLLVGGQEIPVVSFDEIDLADAARTTAEIPPSEPAGRPPAEEAKPPAAAGQEPSAVGTRVARKLVEDRLAGNRWFIMIFDGYNNLSPLRMNQVRRSAKKWVDRNLRTRDMVAVYEFNPYLSSVSGFTNEPHLLKEAIEKVRMFPGTSMGNEMIAQRLEQGGSMPRQVLEQQLRNAAAFGGDLLRAERDQYYMNVDVIGDVMSELDGTKAVLLFSGGFALTRTRSTEARGGFTTRFKQMLENLERNGIRVFSYDIGEEGVFIKADQATNFRLALDELGFGTEWMDTLQVGAQIDAANAHHEILSVLGTETGGRFWRGRDYDSGLQAADDDLSHYYLIGYRPVDSALKGKKGYSRIKVRHENGKLRMISRQGHFADSTPRPPTTVAPAVSLPTATEQPSVSSGPEPLEIDCRPLFYPGPDGRTLVVLPINIEGPLAGIELEDEALALDLDVAIVAKTRDGELLESGDRNVRFRIRPEGRKGLGAGIQLREAVLLPPGPVELSLKVRLNGLGRSGDWGGRHQIPVRPDGLFGLSELALLSPAARKLPVYDVFQRGEAVFGTDPPGPLPDPLGEDAAGRPPLYLRGGFPRDVPLLAQVQVLAPPPGGGQESPLRMDWELIPSTGGVAVAPPVNYRRLQMVEQGRRLDIMVDLDLAAVDPGDYTLRLTAQDLVNDATDIRFYPISVSP